MVKMPANVRRVEDRLFGSLAARLAVQVRTKDRGPDVGDEGIDDRGVEREDVEDERGHGRVTILHGPSGSGHEQVIRHLAFGLAKSSDKLTVLMVGHDLAKVPGSSETQGLSVLAPATDAASKLTGLASALLAPIFGPVSLGLGIISSSVAVAGLGMRPTGPIDEASSSFPNLVAELSGPELRDKEIFLFAADIPDTQHLSLVLSRVQMLDSWGIHLHLVLGLTEIPDLIRIGPPVVQIEIPGVTASDVRDAWPCGDADSRELVELAEGRRGTLLELAEFVSRESTGRSAPEQRLSLSLWLRARVLEKVQEWFAAAKIECDVGTLQSYLILAVNLDSPFTHRVFAFDERYLTVATEIARYALRGGPGVEWPLRRASRGREEFILSPLTRYAFIDLAISVLGSSTPADAAANGLLNMYAICCETGLQRAHLNAALYADATGRHDVAFRIRTQASLIASEDADAAADELVVTLDELGGLHSWRYPDFDRSRCAAVTSLVKVAGAGTGKKARKHYSAVTRNARMLDLENPKNRLLLYLGKLQLAMLDPVFTPDRELLELGRELAPAKSAALVLRLLKPVSETSPRLSLGLGSHSCYQLIAGGGPFEGDFALDSALWGLHFVAKKFSTELHDDFHRVFERVATSGLLDRQSSARALLQICRENEYQHWTLGYASAAGNLAKGLPVPAYAASKAYVLALYQHPEVSLDERLQAAAKYGVTLAAALAATYAPQEEPFLWHLASVSGLFASPDKILGFAHVLAQHVKEPVRPTEFGAVVPTPELPLGRQGATVSVQGRRLGPQDRNLMAATFLVSDFDSILEHYFKFGDDDGRESDSGAREVRSQVEDLLRKCGALCDTDITSEVDLLALWDELINDWLEEPPATSRGAAR